MRIMTPERLRSVGILLLEMAGFALLVKKQFGNNHYIKATAEDFLKKARKL